MLTKTQIILITATLGIATPATAQTNNIYNNIMRNSATNNRTVTQDARSGNTYDTIKNSDGSTSTVGTNQGTGAIWRSQAQPNGDQSGTDADGNQWQKKNGD